MTNGERLKYLREKKRLTQKDVATKLGLDLQQYLNMN